MTIDAMYDTLSDILGEDMWDVFVPGGAQDCDGLPDGVACAVIYLDTGKIIGTGATEAEALDAACEAAILGEAFE